MSAIILPWPRHKRERCCGQHDDGGWTCPVCSGGLFVCSTCGCVEGELATDCPGERLHEDERGAIYNGHVDFVRDRGWVAKGEGVG